MDNATMVRRRACAAALLVAATLVLARAQKPDARDTALGAALHLEEVEGNLDAAIEAYKKIAADARTARAVAASALLHLARCYEKLGAVEARTTYERLTRQYADQRDIAAKARSRLAALDAVAGNGELRARLVWDRAIDIGGTTTADGRWFSYPDWTTGDVGIRDLITGYSRRLTDKGGYFRAKGEVEGTAISADGKWIAFTWFRWDEAAASDGAIQIRVIGSDGRDERLLLAGKDVLWAEPQSWSPDGTWVAAAVRDRVGGTIMLLSPTGAAPRTLFSLRDRRPVRVSFSPDGRWLAFHTAPTDASAAGRNGVYIIAASGAPTGAPTTVATDSELVAWTPDGRALLLNARRNNTMELRIVPVAHGAAAGEPRRLVGVPEVGRAIGFGPRGALIHGRRIRAAQAVVASMDLRTGAVGPLRAMSLSEYGLRGLGGGIRFTRDGRQMLYTTDQGGIVVATLETGPERPVPVQLRRFHRVEWNADGQSIIVTGVDTQGTEGVFRLDPATGAPTLLFAGPGGGPLTSSPDGHTIYYRDSRGAVARDLRSGTDRVVDPSGSAAADFRASPDGHRLAVLTRTSLRIVDLVTGETHLRYQHAQDGASDSGQFWAVEWAPANRSLVALVVFDPTFRGRAELWTLHGDRDEPLRHRLPGVFRGLWLSPDGKQVATVQREGMMQVWALENFLPAVVAAQRGAL